MLTLRIRFSKCLRLLSIIYSSFFFFGTQFTIFQIFFVNLLHTRINYKYISIYQSMKNKQKAKKFDSVFQIYQMNSGTPQYPILLLNQIAANSLEFQKQRASALLLEWAQNYSQFQPIVKEKYEKFFPKIKSKLLQLHLKGMHLQSVIAIMYCHKYQSMNQLTEYLLKDLRNDNSKQIRLFWWICNYLVEKMNEKTFQFSKFLSKTYEVVLRQYISKNFQEDEKLISTIRIMNMRQPMQQFLEHSEQWVLKIIDILKKYKKIQWKLLILELVGAHAILKGQAQFYKQIIKSLFKMLMQTLNDSQNDNEINRRTLNLFLHAITFPQVIQHLKQNKEDFYHNIMKKIQNEQKNKPLSLLNMPKYAKIKSNLYDVYFVKDKQQADKQLKLSLKQFIKNSQEMIPDSRNINYFHLLCQRQITLDSQTIYDLLKILMKRSISTQTAYTIAEILFACRNSSTVNKQSGQIIRLLSKIKIAQINGLKYREQCSNLFLCLLQNADEATILNNTSVLLNWLDSFESSQQQVNLDNLKILCVLIQNKSVFKQPRKLEVLIQAINKKLNQYKLQQQKICKTKFYQFFSIILKIRKTTDHKVKLDYRQIYASHFKTDRKIKNYLITIFQVQIYMVLFQQKCKFESSNQVKAMLNQLLKCEQIVNNSNFISATIVCFEIFFKTVGIQQTTAQLEQIDALLKNILQNLVKQKYIRQFFVLSECFLAQQMQLQFLLKLESYKYVRQNTFELLSIYFQRQKIFAATSLYSWIIIKAKSIISTYEFFNKENFMIDLFKGCQQLMVKQKLYNKQLTSILLLYRIASKEHPMLIENFSQFHKNYKWWRQTNFEQDVKPNNTQNFIFQTVEEIYINLIKRDIDKIIEKQVQPNIKQVRELLTNVLKQNNFEQFQLIKMDKYQ